MRKIFSRTVLSVFFVIVSATAPHANLIVVEFSGSLDRVCDVAPFCNGHELELAVGDPFSGRFSYDPITGPAEFFVRFPNVRLDATNLEIEFQPFDGFLTFFNIRGEIPGGSFMHIGLTNGSPVRDGNLPTSLACADWLLCGFQIKDEDLPAIEMEWLNPFVIGVLNISNGSPEIFSVQTVPEPSSLVLLISGFIGLVIRKWKIYLRQL